MNRTAAAIVTLVLFLSVKSSGESPLTDGLRQLRFSPNGQYILAQDGSRISVLTVQPFSELFQFPATLARAAEFTPDSREIVFLSSAPGPESHVERWSIAERSRTGFVAVPNQACESERLSPDGDILACVDSAGTLRLINVSSGATVFQGNRFGIRYVSYENVCGPSDPSSSCPSISVSGDPGSARFRFSPDARFLVAIPKNNQGHPVAFDFREKKMVRLTGELKHFDSAAFVGPDRMVISSIHWKYSIWTSAKSVQTATLVSFPSGKVISQLGKFPPGVVSQAADPAFVLIRTSATSAVMYRTGQVIASNTLALDVLGNLYVEQLASGSVGLFDRTKAPQPPVTPAGR